MRNNTKEIGLIFRFQFKKSIVDRPAEIIMEKERRRNEQFTQIFFNCTTLLVRKNIDKTN